MMLSRLSRKAKRWLWRPTRPVRTPARPERARRIHVLILDGTMSSLEAGRETHAGQALRLLRSMGNSVSVYYDDGVQWTGWTHAPNVLMGRGINRKIRRAYGYLASRYRPGDLIYLLGYSRGAYAVRSLAGVIDMVGLVRAEHANVRNIRQAYRHYECTPASDHARAFARQFCHQKVEIEMIGVWDTVKALGLRLPFLWKGSEQHHAFHNHALGPSVKHGFHALALHETRAVYDPVLWETPPGWQGHVEQVWFRGSHGDVGGQLNGFEPARPLANLSFIWMLGRAEACGLPLPAGWRDRFAVDVAAPSVGTWRGWGKIFLLRRRRTVGQDTSERLHESVASAEIAGANSWRAPKGLLRLATFGQPRGTS
jgi:uncharacterized protein (DUF2235 family)